MLLIRYLTVHQCIPLDETIQIYLDKLHSLPDPPLCRFKDTPFEFATKNVTLFFMANIIRKLIGSPVGPVPVLAGADE